SDRHLNRAAPEFNDTCARQLGDDVTKPVTPILDEPPNGPLPGAHGSGSLLEMWRAMLPVIRRSLFVSRAAGGKSRKPNQIFDRVADGLDRRTLVATPDVRARQLAQPQPSVDRACRDLRVPKPAGVAAGRKDSKDRIAA